MTLLTSHPTTVFTATVDRTATEPPERRGLQRDQVRLLVGSADGITHSHFTDLGDFLNPGDLLVVNNSRTLPAEIDGEIAGVGPAVAHFATELTGGHWVIELRTAPHGCQPILDAQVGMRVSLGGWGELELVRPHAADGSSPTGMGNRLWVAAAVGEGSLADHLLRWGRPIAYGYLRDRFPLADYQTVFASVPGSAEMPSAGRPFASGLVTSLISAGVMFAPITLHTGVSSQDAGEAPQPEWFEVPEATARLVNLTRAAGGRVIAVGTTATRAIESAVNAAGLVEGACGWTNRVISPEAPVRVIDGLITGWHNPEASHLLLVESVAGPELTQRAYAAAVAQGYLWHEFGDSALLLR